MDVVSHDTSEERTSYFSRNIFHARMVSLRLSMHPQWEGLRRKERTQVRETIMQFKRLGIQMGVLLTQRCSEGRNVFDWFNLTTNRKTGENSGGGATIFKLNNPTRCPMNQPPTFPCILSTLEQGEQFSLKWSIVCVTMCDYICDSLNVIAPTC